jgi:endonuclease-3
MNNWAKDLSPLLEKYGKRRHPLDYENRYQLIMMIILSAQTTDSLVNKIAPELFKAFPSMAEMKLHQPEDLYPYISKIIGFRKKSEWMIAIAKTVGDDKNIPRTISEITKLPGMGRKSANVLIRESGDPAEGVIVDLHVVRVAPRIGVAESEKPDKIEKELMEAFPNDKWNEIGMALSFHGRETCRPKPECERCEVRDVCKYYKTVVLPAAARTHP